MMNLSTVLKYILLSTADIKLMMCPVSKQIIAYLNLQQIWKYRASIKIQDVLKVYLD